MDIEHPSNEQKAYGLRDTPVVPTSMSRRDHLLLTLLAVTSILVSAQAVAKLVEFVSRFVREQCI